MNTDHAAAPAAIYDGEIPPTLRGARILFVDADELSRFLAQELFDRAGIIGTLVKEMPKTTQMGDAPFDCVILDPLAGPGDGPSPLERLRAIPGLTEAPVLAALTGSDRGEWERNRRGGFAGAMTKPFEPSDLFGTIAGVLETSAPTSPSPPPSAPAPEAGEVSLPDSPYLSLRDALARLGNNRKILARVLGHFADEQRDYGGQIAAALARGEPQVAERLAHSLKGAAGNIGALALQEAAKRVEYAVRKGDATGLPQLQAAMEQELTHLIGALDRWRADRPQEAGHRAPPTGRIDLDALLQGMERLQGALQGRRPVESDQGLRELLGLPWPGEYRDALQTLEGLIRRYRFREAEAQVTELRQRLTRTDDKN